MTMIDNRVGFAASLATHSENTLVMLNDNKIYGETEVTDCPEDSSYCNTFDK
jgi:hypothetical protein